jgi:hypothetical protein
MRDLHGIAGIPQAHEVDSLHDAPIGHVEAGNDALG